MNTTGVPDQPVSAHVSPPSPGSGPVVGVKPTMIYCRAVCRPGRAPRPENCTPFINAEAARGAGYRACKQCRPDVPEPRPRHGPTSQKFTGAIRYAVGQTAIGWVFVAVTERGVCALDLLDEPDASPALRRLLRKFPGSTPSADASAVAPVISRVAAELAEGQTCDDVPLDLRGTSFQLRVWEALRGIPRGQTTSYGALARSLGLTPGAARAVGTACGSNPVSLIVPCHRVVAAGGGLGGYYWGLDRKRALLDLEAPPA